jgi:hypothetical protein
MIWLSLNFDFLIASPGFWGSLHFQFVLINGELTPTRDLSSSATLDQASAAVARSRGKPLRNELFMSD